MTTNSKLSVGPVVGSEALSELSSEVGTSIVNDGFSKASGDGDALAVPIARVVVPM